MEYVHIIRTGLSSLWTTVETWTAARCSPPRISTFESNSPSTAYSILGFQKRPTSTHTPWRRKLQSFSEIFYYFQHPTQVNPESQS
jgi:hypothetical protein